MAETSKTTQTTETKRRFGGLAPNIIFLGIVSFLTDVSSDMIFGPLFPLYLANVLGAGVKVIGLITGATEGFASLMNIVSGRLSDRIRKRKLFAVLGYGLSTIAKPFLYISGAWWQVLGIRLTDRVGKGLRSSPRDALIAASSTPETKGKSFGFHRAMDTAGATIGLLIAALVIFAIQKEAATLSTNAFRTLVIVSVVPAALAVLVLYFFVHEPKAAPAAKAGKAAAKATKTALSGEFKAFLVIIGIFTLGNSSDAFLSLRAQTLGTSTVLITMMFLVHNVTYAGLSMPAGVLSDRLGRKRVLLAGWLVYAMSYLGFALASVQWEIWVLFIIYGVYYGFNEGVAKAFIADLVPDERRGTAYGYYNATVGVGLLAASLLAGWVWAAVGPATPFYLGAALAGAAALALAAFMPGDGKKAAVAG